MQLCMPSGRMISWFRVPSGKANVVEHVSTKPIWALCFNYAAEAYLDTDYDT